MQKVGLGKTGLSVSGLCLGTMYMGTTVDEPTSFSILDEYTRVGGSFFDTANKYASWIPGFAGGESETILGRWMRERKNRRDLFIATKVGLPMPGVEKGLRSSQIIGECEKSLRRLGIDAIDLYYAHADDRQTPLEESLRAFDSLVQSGKVRTVGASNYLAWRLNEALMLSGSLHLAFFCCVQMKYSCLAPRPGVAQDFAVQAAATEETFDFCREHQLTLLAYSPLMGGIFGRDDKPLPAAYANEDNLRRIRNVRRLAGQLEIRPNQAVLAWLLHHQNPSVIPIVGASSVEQLKENLQSLDVHLSNEQFISIQTLQETNDD